MLLSHKIHYNTTPAITKCTRKSSTASHVEERLERIRERSFGKVELSPSSYDTAWLAMVPARGSPANPGFPQCLDWIMENQHKDGSWGLNPGHPSLVKDSLSCTLASLLALKKWNLGEQLVQRGLNFINGNAGAVSDNNQISPIGFDIIFPYMINRAREMNVILPLDPVMVNNMHHNREINLKGNRNNLAYVAEGLGKSCNWEELLSQQRSNGSLFNSPATTAAALMHSYDDKCFDYLLSTLKLNNNGSVPTRYPIDVYARLYIVDTLEKLGIARYFKQEIESIVEETYRSWQKKSEDIFTDITCCALAFRLLRMNGYEVTSDELAAYTEEELFFNTVGVEFTGVSTILELYRASEVTIDEDESVLEKIHSWTSSFLKQQLRNHTISDERLSKQVEDSLTGFNVTLQRVENMQSIQLYDPNNCRILKTAYRCPNLDNMEFLLFAKEDFNTCQAQHRKELQQLERWHRDSKLDITSGRNALHVIYFLSATVLFHSEVSEARIAYVQVVTLITYVDDLFDRHGSREELTNMIELVKEWDEPPKTGYYTEEVRVLYIAIYNHVNEWAAKASIKQGRCIKHHLISAWLEFLNGCMKEVEWWSDKTIPTLEEYLNVACMSTAAQASLLTPLFVLGPNLSEDLLTTVEYITLSEHVSFVFRLLNDVRTFEREREERSFNSVSLIALESKGAITEEEAITKVYETVEKSKRKLLKIVLKKASLIPQECKNLFWYSVKNCYYLYRKRDEFSSPKELTHHMNAVVFEPLHLRS